MRYNSSPFLSSNLSAYRPSAAHLPPISGRLLHGLYSPMSINPSPELKSLFETALNEFEKRVGTALDQHPIIDKLVNCESADTVIDVLQGQAQAFRSFRGGDGKLFTWLKRTVNVLYALSTSDVISGAIGSVCVNSSWHWRTLTRRDTILSSAFSSSKCNIRGDRHTSWCKCPTLISRGFCDTCGLLQTVKNPTSTTYDALVELFESFESFLRRLDIYTKIPSTPAMTEIIVKILIDSISTISLAIQQARQGRLSEPHPFGYDT